jgi:putative transposase
MFYKEAGWPRIEKLRYMHWNPVVRGLVQEAGQWPWSSYRSYAFEEVGAVKISQWEWPRSEARHRQHESPPLRFL